MNSLENQILKLSKIAVANNDYKEVEKELQLIGRMLVTDYVIKIGNITIEPFWVEAYYSNVAKEFADPFIHGKEEQSEFGILYFHHKTDDSRSGVDICLSVISREVFGANLSIVIEVGVEEVHIYLRVVTNDFNGLG